ncbi:MAG: hypothetical protein ACPIOQ_17810 [Promethearchaeia archaeon]
MASGCKPDCLVVSLASHTPCCANEWTSPSEGAGCAAAALPQILARGDDDHVSSPPVGVSAPGRWPPASCCPWERLVFVSSDWRDAGVTSC